MIPTFQITANSLDITDTIKDHFINLRLTDKRSLEADTLDIVLDDTGGKIARPPRGAELRLWLGFRGHSLHDKGTFVVDATPSSGPPDIMTIQASSANMRQNLKIERDLSYDFMSVGWIVEKIAKDNGLIPAIEENFYLETIEQLDQTGESDANLITRLAKQFDAVATIKAGHLLFVPVGYRKTVKGLQLPTLSIARSEGDRFTFEISDRESRYSGVKAKWHDHDNAVTRTVLVGEGDNARTLKETYPNANEARTNAQSEWNRIRRAKHKFSLNTANARLDLAPNHPVSLTGWRKDITAIKWICSEVVHNLSAEGGLLSDIALEEAEQVQAEV